MSGYTDEVAEECHDLIEHAEEEAHVRPPLPTYLAYKSTSYTINFTLSPLPAVLYLPSPTPSLTDLSLLQVIN
ncbi:hypothetical protein B0T19DRAFT_406993 [Cercophora scortea]|uniref:Uncharacterized protein n=1 Tax=Cercophora scortea TaxID=314031 RepID=A0AAE0J2D0_9PEZI|nr:hypothetical protein B0T19DRAFT_406993 [Cercophora scortea]